MKKILSVAFVLIMLVTPYVEAKTCFKTSCNYIDTNSGFENGFTDWGIIGSPHIAIGSCFSSNMAHLENTEGVSRQFYVDNAYSSYKINLRAWLVNDADNFYDELRIRVTNQNTGYSELHTLNGASYTNHCQQNVFYLNGDYDNATVTVTIESGRFSLRMWQIDDVGFFAVF